MPRRNISVFLLLEERKSRNPVEKVEHQMDYLDLAPHRGLPYPSHSFPLGLQNCLHTFPHHTFQILHKAPHNFLCYTYCSHTIHHRMTLQVHCSCHTILNHSSSYNSYQNRSLHWTCTVISSKVRNPTKASGHISLVHHQLGVYILNHATSYYLEI